MTMNQEPLEKVSEEDLKKIVNLQIERAIADCSPASNPKAYLLGGQPGAGKSGLIRVIMDENQSSNFVVIDTDKFRSSHPNYSLLKEKYGKNSVDYTAKFAGKVTEKMIECLSEKKYNLVIEGTLRTYETPKKTAELLNDKNYSVQLYIVGVSKYLSSIGITSRYERMYSIDPSEARHSSLENHNHTITQIPQNLERLWEDAAIEKIAVYDRNNQELFSSASVDSKTAKNEIEKVLNTYPDKEVKTELDKLKRIISENNHQNSTDFKNLNSFLSSGKTREKYSLSRVKESHEKIMKHHKNKNKGIDKEI